MLSIFILFNIVYTIIFIGGAVILQTNNKILNLFFLFLKERVKLINERIFHDISRSRCVAFQTVTLCVVPFMYDAMVQSLPLAKM